MPEEPRFPEIVVRLYRLLMRAYPASFRREYGEEMTSVFRDMAEAAWRRRGASRLVVLAWSIVGDFLVNVPRQHVEETGRRIVMWRQFFGPAHWLAALAASLLIAAFVTPADPASQLLVGIPLFLFYLFAHFTSRIWRKRNGAQCVGESDHD